MISFLYQPASKRAEKPKLNTDKSIDAQRKSYDRAFEMKNLDLNELDKKYCKPFNFKFEKVNRYQRKEIDFFQNLNENMKREAAENRDHFEVCDEIYNFSKKRQGREISLLDKIYVRPKSKFEQYQNASKANSKDSFFITNVKKFDESECPTNIISCKEKIRDTRPISLINNEVIKKVLKEKKPTQIFNTTKEIPEMNDLTLYQKTPMNTTVNQSAKLQASKRRDITTEIHKSTPFHSGKPFQRNFNEIIEEEQKSKSDSHNKNHRSYTKIKGSNSGNKHILSRTFDLTHKENKLKNNLGCQRGKTMYRKSKSKKKIDLTTKFLKNIEINRRRKQEEREQLYSRFTHRTKPITERSTMSPTSRLMSKLDGVRGKSFDFTKRKEPKKIQKKLRNLVEGCKEGLRIFPNCDNAIEYGTFVEKVKQKYMRNTSDILQGFSKLNCKDLKRNYKWKLTSQKEEQEGECIAVKEYRTGMLDTRRTVAFIERTKNVAKILSTIKQRHA
ncbi:unnamed protein product [Moneuplotes crassus]|uniref:Uncharacterized protein n=1 Tax=Euplotes crassus TaxID=5936 RepID=A0AAD1U820_EUPCR|nr:unnamed protein product [Moneuplotes crassus]